MTLLRIARLTASLIGILGLMVSAEAQVGRPPAAPQGDVFSSQTQNPCQAQYQATVTQIEKQWRASLQGNPTAQQIQVANQKKRTADDQASRNLNNCLAQAVPPSNPQNQQPPLTGGVNQNTTPSKPGGGFAPPGKVTSDTTKFPPTTSKPPTITGSTTKTGEPPQFVGSTQAPYIQIENGKVVRSGDDTIALVFDTSTKVGAKTTGAKVKSSSYYTFVDATLLSVSTSKGLPTSGEVKITRLYWGPRPIKANSTPTELIVTLTVK